MTADRAGPGSTVEPRIAGPGGTADGRGPSVVIPARFNGPPDSGHGGYTCGVLAGLARPGPGAAAAVTLLAPPALDRPLALRIGIPRSTLWDGDELVATVTAAPPPTPVVDPVSVAVADAAAERFPGRTGHPFPTCFACGPEHPDGLRLAPGPVDASHRRVACVWRPRWSGAQVPPELVWSALDCPAGWVVDLRARPMVLTRMTADVRGSVRSGQSYVVVARRTADHGRTAVNGACLYDDRGGLVAVATAVWTFVRAGGKDA